jgi:hypothetical protein
MRSILSRAPPTRDQSTQTPQNIAKETKQQKMRSFKIHLNNVAPPSLNFNLRFLGNRKRSNLSANAVATEQKATKVRAQLTPKKYQNHLKKMLIFSRFLVWCFSLLSYVGHHFSY